MTTMPLKFGLIATIAATIGILWSADLFLARIENLEMRTEARHDAEAAQTALAQGRTDDAVALFRKAHAMERDNQRYSLHLAEALIADNKLEEAQSILGDVLERYPNDGEANLIEARLMIRQNKLQEAESYYHRAIFGIWPDRAALYRIQVRLELAQLLAQRKSNAELLAELIPLEAEAQDDIAVRKQVAHLYIVAGSPSRAVTAYRALIRDEPEDGGNFAGLGEAELALGNYRSAQLAFQNAIHRGADVQNRLGLATELAALDPTPRGLGAPEKFARGTRILQLALDAL